MRRHRTSIAGLTIALLAITAPASAGASTAGSAGSCGSVDAIPGSISTTQFDRTVLCLVNRERTSRGRRALRRHYRLSRAARAHMQDMLRYRYFAHQKRGRPSLRTRVRRSGYRPLRVFLENLGCGAGVAGTPEAVVRRWMRSSGHRSNILSRRVREIGTAVVFRQPVRCSFGGTPVTLVHVFGSRS